MMINRYSYKDNIWIDLDKPTKEEVRQIAEEFKIEPSVANELVSPNPKPRIEILKDCIYLILHFPAFKHSHTGSFNQEVDFIIGKDFLITAHYDSIDALLQFSKVLEVNAILNKSSHKESSGYLFTKIVGELYKSLLDELSYISDWADRIETKIFNGHEKEMVFELSRATRNLLDFKKIIGLHEEVLLSLNLSSGRVFDEDFTHYTKAVLGEYAKVANSMTSTMESVAELRETNNELLNTKQNEFIKVLTVITFITLPMTLFTSFFQINTVSAPIIGVPGDFWALSGIVISIGLTMFLIFRMKKWL